MGYFEALESAARQPLDDEDGLARIEAASQVLRDDYAKSAYTSRGVLVAATALYERGAADQAKEQLRWLIKTDHRSEEHTSELQSRGHLVCRLLLEKKK